MTCIVEAVFNQATISNSLRHWKTISKRVGFYFTVHKILAWQPTLMCRNSWLIKRVKDSFFLDPFALLIIKTM